MKIKEGAFYDMPPLSFIVLASLRQETNIWSNIKSFIFGQ